VAYFTAKLIPHVSGHIILSAVNIVVSDVLVRRLIYDTSNCGDFLENTHSMLLKKDRVVKCNVMGGSADTTPGDGLFKLLDVGVIVEVAISSGADASLADDILKPQDEGRNVGDTLGNPMSNFVWKNRKWWERQTSL
jgi:hypothetical protein